MKYFAHFFYGWETLFVKISDFMYARVQDAIAKAELQTTSSTQGQSLPPLPSQNPFRAFSTPSTPQLRCLPSRTGDMSLTPDVLVSSEYLFLLIFFSGLSPFTLHHPNPR